MMKFITSILLYLVVFVQLAAAQTTEPTPNPQSPKKANSRPAKDSSKPEPGEPFAKASVEIMKEQCVKLDTEKGTIELEMFPESAPESVRNFLNLVSIGAFDTTTFSRVVPGFVIQGGDIATRQKVTSELFTRSRRTIPDEPSLIRHERGILSMARSNKPNSASSDFFILVRNTPQLDGTFSAFGRVTKGMETVDAINKIQVEGDKPTKPVRINRAIVFRCSSEVKP
jgi:peptidyl-prolyl cis-trans isomerase B (cyclophilin B)